LEVGKQKKRYRGMFIIVTVKGGVVDVDKRLLKCSRIKSLRTVTTRSSPDYS
jgi:hypothetical protein